MIVDDKAPVGTLLSDTPRGAGFGIVAGDAAQARVMVEEFDPDIAMIDIRSGSGPLGLHLGHDLPSGHPDIGWRS